MKQVYTIEDLESRELLDAGDLKPAMLAVIGHPIAHSASPMMHQAALDAAGINERYIRLDIEPGEVGRAFDAMRHLGFRGCNVTVPHKIEAMENCEVSPQAQALGAVNTIVFSQDQTRGMNTDGPGFISAIQDDFDFRFVRPQVCIIGAGGGAGQAIATQCAMLGVKKLVLVNRSEDKLAALVARIEEYRNGAEFVTLSFDHPDLEMHCQSCELLVNTSSVGLKSGDPPILSLDCFIGDQLVYDTIYQPPVTPLLAAAASRGCRTANGLSMLVHQGALAYQEWFPGSNPLPIMQQAMSHLVSRG